MESTIYTVAGREFELQHHGVKGMKWGVRRYQNKDGSLTPKGKKRSRLDRAADAAQRDADNLRKHGYTTEADAVQKVADKNRQKAEQKRQKTERRKQTAKRVAKAVAGTLAKVGEAYVVDQMFFGGYGTTACKEALRTVGMATITAYTMARGGYDIKWYDKAGNRVG